MSERFELPDQARKIRDREAAHLERCATEEAARADRPPAALEAVCRVLSQRQRYMGAMGEHFSVQDLEGILVVDYLDERLLRAVLQVLQAYRERAGGGASPETAGRVQEAIDPVLRELPPYPVGYVVLYHVRRSFERFYELGRQHANGRHAELEHAFACVLLEAVERYVRTRELPVQRHFSDVEREYSSVRRLKCGCGEEKYEVALQSLHAPEGATPFDRLDLRCGRCGAKRTVTFDLPAFRDMYQL